MVATLARMQEAADKNAADRVQIRLRLPA